jgi:hypothetical protein
MEIPHRLEHDPIRSSNRTPRILSGSLLTLGDVVSIERFAVPLPGVDQARDNTEDRHRV